MPDETTTSTTIVITYGRAFVQSTVGPSDDVAGLQLRRERLQRAEEVRADEAELGPPEREDDERDRDPAAPPVIPSTHCGVIASVIVAPATPANAPPTSVCDVAVRA